jgi:hypothetical protein
MQLVKFVLFVCAFVIISVCNAQQLISIPLQTTIDTITIGNAIQLLQKGDQSIQIPPIITPLKIADTIVSNANDVDTLDVLHDTVQEIVQEFINPENISISKIITGEYWIGNTKHTDIMIDSSIISKLVIENITCSYLSISALSVTQISIKNSVISEFEVEDSSIGELIIENTKITDFSTDQSVIRKQTIISKPQKYEVKQQSSKSVVQPTNTIDTDDDDDE